MKVILSIDPVQFPLTGIGRYTFELAHQLKKLPQIEQLNYFSTRHIVSDLPKPSVISSQSVSQPTSLRHTILKNGLTKKLVRLVSPLITQQALRGHSDFIFHGTNYYVPKFTGKSVCTIHDLSIFTWAHCHPPERIKLMRKEIALTLKRVDMLITDSEYSRHEVAKYFGWPIEKIRNVPLACTSDFRPRTSDELSSLLQKYGLTSGGYSLFVGTIEPRKNLETLLEAYAMLPLNMRRQWPLILVGHRGWRSEHLHARIEHARVEGWARYLGFADSEELPLLYAGARLFVFPSLYEGFGLPVLEAMASGVPVVCSSSSSLPEVAGDAAGMCESKDVDSLCSWLQIGLEDEVWRTASIQKGLIQSSRFSWKRCAEETLAVYREATT